MGSGRKIIKLLESLRCTINLILKYCIQSGYYTSVAGVEISYCDTSTIASFMFIRMSEELSVHS